MAAGVIEFLKRLTAPSAPATGYAGIYVDDSGSVPRPIVIDDDGTEYGFDSVYGRDFTYNQNLNPATNTTTNPQAYATAVYNNLDGDSQKIYEIDLGFTYRYSTGQRDFIGELNIIGNGTTTGVVKVKRQEPKDNGGDQRFWASGKYYLNGQELGAGGQLVFQFYAQQNGDTAEVFDGFVNVKRVL